MRCSVCPSPAKFRQKHSGELLCSRLCQVNAILGPNLHLFAIGAGKRPRDPAEEEKRKGESDEKKKKEEEKEEEKCSITLTPIAELDPSAVVEMAVGHVIYKWDLDAIMTWVMQAQNKGELPTNPLTREIISDANLAMIMNKANTRREVLKEKLMEFAKAGNIREFRETLALLQHPYSFVVTPEWVNAFQKEVPPEIFADLMKVIAPPKKTNYDITIEEVNADNEFANGYKVKPASDSPQDVATAFSISCKNRNIYPKVDTIAGTFPLLEWIHVDTFWTNGDTTIDDTEMSENDIEHNGFPFNVATVRHLLGKIPLLTLYVEFIIEKPHILYYMEIRLAENAPPLNYDINAAITSARDTARELTAYDYLHYQDPNSVADRWPITRDVMSTRQRPGMTDVSVWKDGDPIFPSLLFNITDNPWPKLCMKMHEYIVAEKANLRDKQITVRFELLFI